MSPYFEYDDYTAKIGIGGIFGSVKHNASSTTTEYDNRSASLKCKNAPIICCLYCPFERQPGKMAEILSSATQKMLQ